MLKRLVQFSTRDLIELTFVCAVAVWCLCWEGWSATDRVFLVVVAVGAMVLARLVIPWQSSQGTPGLFAAATLGALLSVAYGPTLLAYGWPIPFVEPGIQGSGLAFFFNVYVATIFEYLIAIWWLSVFGVLGGLVIANSYLFPLDLGRSILARTRRVPDSRRVPLSRKHLIPLVLRGACFTLASYALLLGPPVFRKVGVIQFDDHRHRPWAFTADGRFLVHFNLQGGLDFYQVQTARLKETKTLRRAGSEQQDGGLAWDPPAGRMWFLPGGKELLLDCWPELEWVNTSTWQVEPMWPGNGEWPRPESLRGISDNGRIAVTSPEHPSYQLQNNTTLTIWDMAERKVLRQAKVRPEQNLWIMDDVIQVNEAGNLLVLQVRHGTRPGGGIEVWDLQTDRLTPFEIINSSSAQFAAEGARLAHFHFLLDLRTGQQRQLLQRATNSGFVPPRDRLLMLYHEGQKSGLPVIGTAVGRAFDRRLLLYDETGSRILAVSPRLPEDGPAFGQAIKISPDGRHVAVPAGQPSPTRMLIYAVPGR